MQAEDRAHVSIYGVGIGMNPISHSEKHKFQELQGLWWGTCSEMGDWRDKSRPIRKWPMYPIRILDSPESRREPTQVTVRIHRVKSSSLKERQI